MDWIKVEDRLPNGAIDNEVQVVGFSEKWKHPDFNPLGQRVCHLDDLGWYSVRYNGEHGVYIEVDAEEGDNPTHWQPMNESPI